MLNNIFKLLVLITVFSFYIVVFNYYFSEKNINKIKNKRNNLETQIVENVSELPVLLNDTNDIINFNSGFDDHKKHNFKRSFWELFK